MIETITTNEIALLNSFTPKKYPKMELCGVLFDADNNRLVSTDTRTLIVINVQHDVNGIVPKSTVNIAAKIGTKNNPVEMRPFSQTVKESEFIGFLSDNDAICGRHINGAYPNIDRIIHSDAISADNVVKISAYTSTLYFEIAETGAFVDQKSINTIAKYCIDAGIKTVDIDIGAKDTEIMISCDRFCAVVTRKDRYL